VSVDAPCTEVHFAVNVYGHSFDVPVNDGKADIPDVLLQTDGNLNVWGFVGTAGDGYTRISKVFRVNRRNKPAGYTYTPTAQISLEAIRKEIEETKIKLGEKIGAEELGEAVADALGKLPSNEYIVSVFEELKALIKAGNTEGAIAVLDEAILDLAVLA
jgi:hypothetical protein